MVDRVVLGPIDEVDGKGIGGGGKDLVESLPRNVPVGGLGGDDPVKVEDQEFHAGVVFARRKEAYPRSSIEPAARLKTACAVASWSALNK